ncbi:unnamed protein product [Zymoseptoria tritici ST99CH_3D1]|uniref:Uncharacterized protein n=1 Tax=Zymoseptoria tritici (strain ST99CH_3D7) TaxID=1276538 RepID=A0A1X7RUW6_ZYMT9|nr:unnamed protein product [Zymoseptoria tritici ST99CH_3D7]SMR54743.1 unnamed protein product [Zymoseptoria tritici ST99CH_3D1]
MDDENPYQVKRPIPIDSSIPLDSVQQLIHEAKNPVRASRHAPVPPPTALAKKSKMLKDLRRATVWKHGTRDSQAEQMDVWFPSIQHAREGMSAYEDVSEKVIKIKKEPLDDDEAGFSSPTSDIGTLAKLPGELRNRIYRYAVVQSEPGPVKVTMPPLACALGACLHARTGYNVPALAQTCAQLRSEVLPIFLAENEGFEFDAGTVQQSCVGNWLRSLGSYADFVSGITLTVERAICRGEEFIRWTSYAFDVYVPGMEFHGGVPDRFVILQKPEAVGLVCQCALETVVKGMNRKSSATPTGVLLEELVDSEELADLVWQLKKTKAHVSHLKRCKGCSGLMFHR